MSSLVRNVARCCFSRELVSFVRPREYHVKSPKYLFGNSPNFFLNITKNFSRYLDKPSKYLLFLLEK